MTRPPPGKPQPEQPSSSRLRPAARFLACTVAALTLFCASLSGQSKYAGSEACQTCHEDIAKSFQESAHHAISEKRAWEKQVCESCHGPGAQHAETADPTAIQNPAKLPPAAGARACLSCHANQAASTGRIRSSHARNQVSCTGCHSVHQSREQLVSRKAAVINTQCSACHTSVRAEFQRPHAHNLPQGAMSCVDCHNPHGTVLARSVRTVSANEPGCLKCHGDKRGPFAFEHAPLRLEGCSSCHQPHGSANPRMLTRPDVAQQCLECHANVGAASGTLGGVPPAFHDLRSARFRNCTTCHVKVHGSHVNRALLR